MRDASTDMAFQMLVEHLANRPEFMAYALKRYQEQEQLSSEKLAEQLGAPFELMRRLSLSKRPNPQSENFRLLVQELADYCLADEAALATMLRQVEWLDIIDNSSSKNILVAARDREISDVCNPPDSSKTKPGSD
jgi:hypothetical protein